MTSIAGVAAFYLTMSTDGKDDLDNIMSTTLLEWSMNPSE